MILQVDIHPLEIKHGNILTPPTWDVHPTLESMDWFKGHLKHHRNHGKKIWLVSETINIG